MGTGNCCFNHFANNYFNCNFIKKKSLQHLTKSKRYYFRNEWASGIKHFGNQSYSGLHQRRTGNGSVCKK